MDKKLFIFDLDFTLWDAGGEWCDCNQPPYYRRKGEVFDSRGANIMLYPDVKKILNELQRHEKIIAIASRTSAPTNAIELLNLFNISVFFHFKEIFPGSKIQHMNNLSRRSGVCFKEMVFFDDEMRNIHDTSSLGIQSIYVEDGIKFHHIINFLN